MYYIYILECNDATLYTGITKDLERRFKEHKEGKGGAYTRTHGVRKMMCIGKRKNRSEAQKREAEVKQLRREEKIKLVLDS